MIRSSSDRIPCQDGRTGTGSAGQRGCGQCPGEWLDRDACCAAIFASAVPLASVRISTCLRWPRWCGQDEALTYVLDHLDHLRVMSALPGSPPVRPLHEQRQRLAATLRARPYAFVAQEQVPLSTVPVWRGGSVQPRHTVWRAIVVATEDGYAVMPGGLTRVSADAQTLDVSMQRGRE